MSFDISFNSGLEKRLSDSGKEFSLLIMTDSLDEGEAKELLCEVQTEISPFVHVGDTLYIWDTSERGEPVYEFPLLPAYEGDESLSAGEGNTCEGETSEIKKEE